MLKTSLPEKIVLPTGEVLTPYIGHLKINEVVSICKELGKKYRKIEVLSTRLRGVRDLHGSIYKPTKWIFTNL